MPQMAYSPDVVYSVYYKVNLVHIYYYVPVTRHYDRNDHMPGEVMGPQEFHLLVVGVRVVSMACICDDQNKYIYIHKSTRENHRC